jgi:hypothetical protein
MEQELEIPPELDYIMQACRAVSKDKYQEALGLVKEGLRENSGIAEQIDTSLFITLLRALVVELEIRSEEHFRRQ